MSICLLGDNSVTSATGWYSLGVGRNIGEELIIIGIFLLLKSCWFIWISDILDYLLHVQSWRCLRVEFLLILQKYSLTAVVVSQCLQFCIIDLSQLLKKIWDVLALFNFPTLLGTIVISAQCLPSHTWLELTSERYFHSRTQLRWRKLFSKCWELRAPNLWQCKSGGNS